MAEYSTAGEGPGALLIPGRLAAWTWVLGYTAILSTLSILRYHLFLTTGFDLGLYEQGLWLILHEGLAAVTTYTHLPILSQDGSWLLILLAPLFGIGGAGFLLVAQSFALGLGYILVRRVARDLDVPDSRAHLVGALYLLYPTVFAVNLFDFHPEAILVPMLLAAIAASLERRTTSCAVWFALALLTSDAAALPIAAFALALLASGRRSPAVAAASVAGPGLWLDVHVLLPRLAHVTLSASALLGQPLWTALASPTIFRHPFDARVVEYIAWMLVPPALPVVFGAPRRLALWWLPAAAVLALNVALGSRGATSPFEPGSLPAVPFLFLAFAATQTGPRRLDPGVSESADSAAVPRGGARKREIATGFGVLIAAIATAGALGHQVQLARVELPHNATQLNAALDAVPPSVPVIAQNFVLPPLSTRPVALEMDDIHDSIPADTYVLLDTATSADRVPESIAAALAQAVSANAAKVLDDHSGVVLYRTTQSVGLPPSGS